MWRSAYRGWSGGVLYVDTMRLKRPAGKPARIAEGDARGAEGQYG